MKYFYGEYDGTPFPTPDKLFSFDQLMNFIMQYGDQAMKAIQQMMNDPENPQQSDLLEQLLKEAQAHPAGDWTNAAQGADGSLRQPA
jgi:Ca-activated chloride channel homolog